MPRLRVLARGALLAALVLAGLVLLGTRWGDRALYPPAGRGIPVYLVSNGFHSGLVLPRPEVSATAAVDGRGAVLAVATRFAHYDWIETGWGEERFYRAVPDVASIDWSLAFQALIGWSDTAALHVVGVTGDPRPAFAGADLVRIDLSEAGFQRLLAALERSFARDGAGLPVDLGPGLYGPSLFYRATGRFSLANVCNHWTARLLDAAGVPISLPLATLPGGLVLDLALRSHLRREPDALPAGAGTQ